MIEENLYSSDDKEKKNIFKFFIYVLKKNSSYTEESFSINDFLIEDILNFLKGMADIISGKKLESDYVCPEKGSEKTWEDLLFPSQADPQQRDCVQQLK